MEEDENKNKELLSTKVKPFILLIFIEFTENKEESMQDQELLSPIMEWIVRNKGKNRKFELYFSSSWNEIFIKIGFDNFDELNKICSDELFKKQEYKTTTIILYDEKNSMIRENIVNGAQTFIEFKSTYKEIPCELEEKLKELNKYITTNVYTLGLTDLSILWNPATCIEDINNFVRSLLFYDDNRNCIIDSVINEYKKEILKFIIEKKGLEDNYKEIKEKINNNPDIQEKIKALMELLDKKKSLNKLKINKVYTSVNIKI
jgi:hypothetical protein